MVFAIADEGPAKECGGANEAAASFVNLWIF
jgi:hypothetical protein